MNKPARVTADWVRENFPECSRIADDFRGVFGEGVKMTACEENGAALGKFTDPKDYQGVRARELFFLGLDGNGKPMQSVGLTIVTVKSNGK